MKSLILVAGLAAPYAVSAAEESAPPPTTLEPVVVTATRTNVPESQELASVTVIDREQIEHAQATDVAEVLRFTAGIELGRSGGPGQQTSVFIRGANSAHTLVLIDGQRINRLTLGGATFENISPDMIERIEIVKGPRATLYGSDAIGGVINIITRRADGLNGELRLRGGSKRTGDAGAFLGYAANGNEISLNAQHQQTDGIPAVAGQTLDRSFRQNSFNLAGGTHFGGVKWSAQVWDAWSTAEYFGFNPVTFAPDVPLSHDLHNLTASVAGTANPTRRWETTVTLAHSEDRIDERQSSEYLHNERPSLNWHNVVTLDNINRLSFGAEAAREQVDAVSFGSPVMDQRELYNGFVQDELSYGRHRGLIAVSGQHNQAFGSHYNWNAEYGYDLFSATRLIASAGTAFHAPTAFDRYGFGGNPNLKPESSRSYELGLKQGIGKTQTIDLRLFRTDVDNLFDYPPPTFTATNIGHSSNLGAELNYRAKFEAWSGRISGILQNPVDRGTGANLLRRSKRNISGELTRSFGENYLGLDVLAVSKRPDFDINTFAPTDDGGYTLLNLTGGLKLGKHFSLDARAENLLNKKYQTANGYNQPGASYYATLRYIY